MASHYLQHFFAPSRIAVIGASERPGAVGTRVFANLLEGGFKGDVVPINPNRETVAGHACPDSVRDMSPPPDLVVICVAARHLPGVLEDCARVGVHAALIIAASLMDAGRNLKRIEQRALEAARRHEIRVIGPDWVGLMRPPVGLNASFSKHRVTLGQIALVSQSGAVTSSALDWAADRGIGFSTVVSLGDTRDVDFGDLLDFLATDPTTRSILLFIEAVGDARRFLSGLRAAARLKPVIVMKAGRHDPGAAAARSHTGRLVGRDDAFTAAVDRAGAVRVREIGQLFSVAELLASGQRLSGDRIAVLGNGGGPGIIATDLLLDRGLRLAKLAADSERALASLMPPCGEPGNPVNLLGDADAARYGRALSLCLADDGVDGVLTLLSPQVMTDPVASADAIREAADGQRKPVLACWLGGGSIRTARKTLTEQRFPNFATPENAVEALSALARYRDSQQRLLQVPAAGERAQEPDVNAARRIIAEAQRRGQPRLTPMQSKQVLAAFRLPVIPTVVVRSAEAAAEAAAEFDSPVAVKINSVAIAHKADVGGVRLNITTPSAAAQAYEDIVATVTARYEPALLDGCSVEPMHAPQNGREIMLGAVRDPVFGPVLSFGAGGSMVEMIQDRACGLPPLNDFLARDMLQRSRVGAFLGLDAPSALRGQLEQALLRLSDLVCLLPEICDVDVNPVIVDADSLVAVDARIHLCAGAPRTDPTYPHMAIMPYPAHLARHETLADGEQILVRPIRPEDAELEQRFFADLSPRSRYFRFMEHIQALSTTALVRFTQIDYDREMALVAVRETPVQIEALGVARYIINPDGVSCEFALAVADAWHGRGVGRRLMERLMETARSRGLAEIKGEVLANNQAMLGLMTRLGFNRKRDPEDLAITHVSRPLAEP